MELAYQSNSANASTNSLTSYYTNSNYLSNTKSNQNMIFHDDNSFYKPGSVNNLNHLVNHFFDLKKYVLNKERVEL